MITAALALALVSPSTAQDVAAQQPGDDGPTGVQQLRHRAGLAPRIALISGFGDGGDGGFGFEGTAGIRLGDSPVWIRGDAGFVDLGETLHSSDGSTSGNTLVTLVAGPEIGSHRGIVRPFLHVMAGYVLNVPGGDASPAETNGSATYGFGGGVRFRLSSAPRPALIEAGLRFTQSGKLTFALADDIDNADVATYEVRLGLLLGLP